MPVEEADSGLGEKINGCFLFCFDTVYSPNADPTA